MDPEQVAYEQKLAAGGRRMLREVGAYPGNGLPKEVSFPDPGQPGVAVEIEGVRAVTLETLVELKLASGTSAPHRLRDLADVQDLIIHLDLPLALADKLAPSVRAAYHDLWHKAQDGVGND